VSTPVKAELDEMRIENGKLPSYAWPGGYPLFYVTGNNDVLCPDCANADGYEEDNLPRDCGINHEDPDLYCDDCGERIESAYADE
jgi:hypothetical protein